MRLEKAPLLEIRTRTDIGSRDENQDAHGHWESDHWCCLVVADGAGGHEGGKIAASLAVHHFLESFRENPTVEGDQLRHLISTTNDFLKLRQTQDWQLANMHSTIVALILDKKRMLANHVHVGDSRLYLCRNNETVLLTVDHSLANRLDLLPTQNLANKIFSCNHLLYSALGQSTDQLTIDVLDVPREVSWSDRWVLCTDGAWQRERGDQLQFLTRERNWQFFLDTTPANADNATVTVAEFGLHQTNHGG